MKYFFDNEGGEGGNGGTQGFEGGNGSDGADNGDEDGKKVETGGLVEQESAVIDFQTLRKNYTNVQQDYERVQSEPGSDPELYAANWETMIELSQRGAGELTGPEVMDFQNAARGLGLSDN